MEDVTARKPLERARTRVGPTRWDALFLAVAALIVAADQLTKWLVREGLERGESWPADWPVKLVHVTNSGAAFGILQGAGPLLVVTTLVGIAAIVIYLLNPEFAHPLMRAGLALMMAGAVGNLIDRLWKGEVVDFVKAPHFPAFNVADSAITIGVFVLIWAMLFHGVTESTDANS
ncbi:MAG: signal peptidase II [Dehalococcoidia bacterium]|nr:MAG: signal peptidase II [bacterium]MCE7928219.1 signal peptidase II [Chloroflexi bacterium CFX7]MCK6565288.1 signal peptidase II [Dehalococcoidia bacterium]MCL4230905.1 signal peptidase II [Dehalococcoidia bacterium]NUQ56823.1 signal peptidase II [Dehalococcoidia bacterium]